ncbi:DUF1223 domain-containing protein [Hoeflea sp. YIM 152468]|uniref:DUF1223 domain-containing protein n=1 Tax=Hoeflea sp. YIM 152468 TaxID=3031759 RepID=UPI0023DA30D6|nr:DUF1223 domain-containing protein [Hoeflea sp. YIM 152468]MDF1608191.1 DUF1223 domain-containing protein [Hoeflea sp. YIM 152468]
MTARISFLALALPVLLAAAHPDPARANDLAGVVELFTSQGCSSCPPADAELSRLAETGEVLALSYHVDYWNYLGWADTLSSKANTDRQYGYAKSFRRNNVYTPQAVINGQDHANGADGAAVMAILTKLSSIGAGLSVEVNASMGADQLNISVGAGEGKADIVVVYFDEATTVQIKRGENAGQSITYRNSVRDMETVGMWEGKAMSLKLPPSVLSAHPGRGCAILLQIVGNNGTPGRILGAALIESPNPT